MWQVCYVVAGMFVTGVLWQAHCGKAVAGVLWQALYGEHVVESML